MSGNLLEYLNMYVFVMNVKLVLLVLTLYVIAFKFVYFISD